MKSRFTRIKRLLSLALVLALMTTGSAAYFVWQDYHRFIDQPLPNGKRERVLEVKRGDSFVHVLARLREIGVNAGHDLYWRGLAFELGVMRRLQVGEYAVEHTITPRQLLHKLERGGVIQHRFTIIPGWTFRELRLSLQRNDVLGQTIAELSDAAIMQQLGAEGLSPEGQFLPETYQFTRGSKDIDILRRSHSALRGALDRAWRERAADLPLSSPDEALILASIIEKETGVAAERAEIAGVFVRRLRIGMRLQTDPTVIFGVGTAFDGNLTRVHLETDTPWNTYTRPGLPPTPIALAGWDALYAAVHPADGDSLYFVAKGDGSHAFSRTLAEHNTAVRRYQLRRR